MSKVNPEQEHPGGVAAESPQPPEEGLEMNDESRCEVEWEKPKGLCKPHRCDLLAGHKGNHVCDCGWTRRFMKRDEPERETETTT